MAARVLFSLGVVASAAVIAIVGRVVAATPSSPEDVELLVALGQTLIGGWALSLFVAGVALWVSAWAVARSRRLRGGVRAMRGLEVPSSKV